MAASAQGGYCTHGLVQHGRYGVDQVDGTEICRRCGKPIRQLSPSVSTATSGHSPPEQPSPRTPHAVRAWIAFFIVGGATGLIVALATSNSAAGSPWGPEVDEDAAFFLDFVFGGLLWGAVAAAITYFISRRTWKPPASGTERSDAAPSGEGSIARNPVDDPQLRPDVKAATTEPVDGARSRTSTEALSLLRQLGQLRTDGVITEEQFEAKREELLGEI